MVEVFKKSDPDFVFENDDKINVHINAVGRTPILKKTKFLVARREIFQKVINVIRHLLTLGGVL